MNTQESNNESKQTIKQTVEKTTEISESMGIIENNINYSLTDEYHQSCVPGRTSLFTDCLIDTSGGVIACIIFIQL